MNRLPLRAGASASAGQLRARAGVLFGSAVAIAAVAFAWPGSLSAQQAAAGAPGKATYDKWCAGCHGVDGKGAGPAALRMLPRPRDFTKALFQVRTTPTGALPTDADILRVIDRGMPGTAMPGWEEHLSADERESLVQYIKTFSPFFKNQKQAAQPMEFPGGTSSSPEVIAEGRKVYEKIECFKCHGAAGRGDGNSAREMEDDEGHPMLPADLSQNWLFNGGGEAADIYRILRTGLDGTPMPGFSDLIDGKVITDDQLWAVSHYVRSLSPEKPPVVRDVVRARQIEGALPVTANDSAWADVESYYVPLIAQIIIKPRWFAPAVSSVNVQALHDGKELALRITWTDRSKSPDPAWNSWQTRITAAVAPKEDASTPAGASATDSVTEMSVDAAKVAPAAAQLPDMLTVQFPRSIPPGMERPYFLMGNARDPVYLWQWKSSPDAVSEALAKGITQITPLAGGSVASNAVFENGQWQLVLRRALTVADTTNRIQFSAGRAIPMAFFAWDGNSGEESTRGAVSTWYFVYLDQPTPMTVYTTPVVAAMLTAGLGLLVVVRAQRRERNSQSGNDSTPG
jgi:mono/diheme cytochrome c family protein